MKRNLAILLGVLVLLWGGWYLYSTSERKSLAVPQRRDFFWVDTLTVDSLAVKYADWTHLARQNGRWIVKGSTWDYPADENRLSSVIGTTNDMVLENIISTNPAKFDKFEVDTVRGRVMRFFADGQPLAEFVIGKLGAGFSHTYVRQLNSDSVYLARGRFQQIFTMVPDQWKSRVIFEWDSTVVDTIRWIYPDSETRLARGPDRSWTVWKTGLDQPQPVDTGVVNAKLSRICPLRTDAFHPEGNPNVPTFDTLGLQLIVVAVDGAADTLVWNYFPEGQGKSFARRPGQEQPTFIFFRSSYDQLAARYEDLVMVDTTASPS